MDHRSLNLSITPQLSKLGRPYRLSAIVKNLQMSSKWINKVEHWHWFYVFVYTDDNSFFGFEFDYYDKFVQKFNHEQSLKLFKNG
jgi:hypothetical protein